jgi:FixJ family two-component response regulator
MKNILIVDDEDGIRDALKLTFASHDGVETFEASNAKQALEIIKNKNMNCIISDINMPEMGGIEFATQLKAIGKEIPIIFISGFADKEIAIDALRLGAFDFIEKPFRKETIVEAISKALTVE